MKFNKILALSVSAMMIFSSVASAALPINKGTNSYMTETPEEAEFTNRAPKLVFGTPVQLTDKGEIAEKTDYIWDDFDLDAYDAYAVEFSITDIGDLFAGKMTNSTGAKVTAGLFDINIQLATTEISELFISEDNVLIGTTAFGAAQGTIDPSKFIISWSNPASYPTYLAKGTYVEDVQVEPYDIIFKIEKGKTVTITDIVMDVTYQLDYEYPQAQNAIVPESLVFVPAGDETAELAMEVKFETKTSTGYVWEASITKGTKDISAFKATFVSEGDSIDRSISNIGELVKQFEGKGSYAFNIGLITGKTLNSATFTVEDEDGAFPVVAPLGQ